ncbi:MAG: histidine phosphatase family protein [Lachnospiraceae bacterium]|nr:histidine phosphatase family protein [Lachnospiraceae bacterium]
MRIIFVRHGHPDYSMDCLTELGHKQAAATAIRLKEEGIQKIYASSCGRALETAEYISRELTLSIERCDFAREIDWGSIDGEPIFQNGNPWYTVEDMVTRGQPVMYTEWMDRKPFSSNKVVSHVRNVSQSMDTWLSTLGYEREGDFYRVGETTKKTIAMFSHAGSSSAMLAHLFNIPFPFVCHAMSPKFTGITTVSFSDEEGTIVSPKFEILNDARHIQNLQVENIYGN